MLFEFVTTVPAEPDKAAPDVPTVPPALVLPEELSCPAVFVPLDATPDEVLQRSCLMKSEAWQHQSLTVLSVPDTCASRPSRHLPAGSPLLFCSYTILL